MLFLNHVQTVDSVHSNKHHLKTGFLFDLLLRITFDMALVKNALVSLIFIISLSRINGQMGIKTAPLTIYPNLTEFRNSSNSIVYNVVGNSTHFYDVVRYPQFNSTKDQFLNTTLSRISSGVCVKEVP